VSLQRVRIIHERLTDAMRRHGPVTVIKVIVQALFRYGLVATVRLGGADRPFPWNRKTSVQTQALADRPTGPPDLDPAFTLELSTWRRRLALWAEEDLAERDSATLSLVAVVQGAPAAADRTRAALADLGPEVRPWRPGEPGPGPGGFWLFLQAGDLPEPNLPRMLARAAQEGAAEVLSFDLWRKVGDRVQPLLLPGANPTLLRSTDYLFSRLAVAAEAVPAGADPQTLDPRSLVLDWMQGRPAHQVRARWRHVRRPLACIELPEDTLALARRQALEQGRRPLPPRRGEPISAVICTKDKGHLTRQLVGRLLDEGPDLVGEVIIVANNTRNPYALQALEDLARSERVTVLRRDEPFNFSRLSNAGARAGAGRGPLLFLNDDIAPVSKDWLARLAARLDEPDAGAVGPLLLYPDERVQHAGIYLGKRGDAGHILRAASLPADDYLFTACAARESSALTGAALLTPRAAFEALGGFDEQLATGLQDVDYCLRLRAIGLVNVFEPASVLIHMESASIRQIDAGQEFQRLRLAERTRFRERWGDLLLNDPLHPRGFDLEDESLRRLAGADGSRPKSR
jgi:GT2 family glycosyltransferase